MRAGGALNHKEAHPGSDHRAAEHRHLADVRHIVKVEIAGEFDVAHEVGDQAEGGGGDHHRHGGEPVQPVGEVHRIARPHDDEGPEREVEPAEVEKQPS